MGPFADSVPWGYEYVSEGGDDDEGADAKMSDDNSNPDTEDAEMVDENIPPPISNTSPSLSDIETRTAVVHHEV